MTTLFLYKAMFIVCLVFLLMINVRIYSIKRTNKMDEMPTLRWLSFGMNLSALSYVVRIVEFDHPNKESAAPLLCMAGTVAIVLGWLRLTEMIAARSASAATTKASDDKPAEAEILGDEGWASLLGLDATKFNITGRLAETVLLAIGEAERRGECEIDTEHLLLGLLHEPNGLARYILKRLNVSEQAIRATLVREAPELSRIPRRAKLRKPSQNAVNLPVTDGVAGFIRERLSTRSLQIFQLAAGEARRFDSEHIGTEHLLLALALCGDGIAAHTLMQCGANAERIREEIMQIKLNCARQAVKLR